MSNDSLDAKQSNNYKPTTTESEFEKSVEEEIEQARTELTEVVFAKQKEVVRRMGEALEKIRKGEKRHSICEELKNRLREEISGRIISERTIENHCKQEWKDPYKSRSGKKGASSKNKSSSLSAESFAAPLETMGERGQHEKPEKQREHAILVNTHGTIDPMTDDITKDIASSTIGNNSSEYDAQLDKVAKLSSTQTARPIFHDQTVSPHYIEFEFWLPFSKVEKEMKRRFAEHGTAAKLWFNGLIEATTAKVFTVNVGRIDEVPDENYISDTGNQ